MIRTSKHTLKFANQLKLDTIQKFYLDYKELLQVYVQMILGEKLPQKSLLSSKDLPVVNSISHSQWKQVAYKQATETVKSLVKKTRDKTFRKYRKLYSKCMEEGTHSSFTGKRFSELNINFTKRIPKIQIKNLSIPIDSRLVDFKTDNTFDLFMRIKTPHFHSNKKLAITVNVPIKHHRQSNMLRDQDCKRKNTVLLKRGKDGMFYVSLFWEKNPVSKRPATKQVGIDVGYKKLISSSSGVHYGTELNQIYEKISKKKQGSKKFKRALIERNDLINFAVKQFVETEQPDEVIIESLKNVKQNSSGKIFNKTMNKLQRWSYVRTFTKLEQLSESEGFMIKKVNPAFTSQTCSNCGCICKESRQGEIYKCVKCGMVKDADYNAALNILQGGAYGPSSTET